MLCQSLACARKLGKRREKKPGKPLRCTRSILRLAGFDARRTCLCTAGTDRPHRWQQAEIFALHGPARALILDGAVFDQAVSDWKDARDIGKEPLGILQRPAGGTTYTISNIPAYYALLSRLDEGHEARSAEAHAAQPAPLTYSTGKRVEADAGADDEARGVRAESIIRRFRPVPSFADPRPALTTEVVECLVCSACGTRVERKRFSMRRSRRGHGERESEGGKERVISPADESDGRERERESMELM